MSDRPDRYLVIGAGAAGIATAKNLRAHGIPFDLVEREDDVGGNWYYGKPCSSIYRSVHLISSKAFTQFADTPMPAHWPTYLRAEQALEYLRGAARRHGVYEHAEFGRSVLEITPVRGRYEWDAGFDDGSTRRYRGVFVCNGHLSMPRLPDYPGRFDGLQLHSSQYKTPDVLAGQRVLVVGAGNSGCDIAVEAVHHARAVFHSTRRGYYYWPKFLFGIPADRWAEGPLRWRMPLWARRFFGRYVLQMHAAGRPEDYGLPAPDHKLFESHFIINSTLFYHLGHGDIAARPDVQALDGRRVRFADGREEEIDVIVWATGFRLSMPFLDQAHLDWPKDKPRLALNVFDARHPNLFFIGLFQTSTGNWPLMDEQARLVARYLRARQEAPRQAARFERRLATLGTVDAGGGIRFSDTPRHAIEFEHASYRRRLAALERMLPVPRLEAPLAPAGPLEAARA